ncbi:hypothetical protein BgiBS90_019801 [Biomphalaria glabrata]|nr:hypothetical protein BgiBS90_019801 [Biomphalaria glabrata]
MTSYFNVIYLTLCHLYFVEGATQTCAIKQNSSIKNKTTTSWMFQESLVSSKLDCAAQCLTNPSCITYMINRNTKVCRLFSTRITQYNTLTSEAGYLSYDTCRGKSNSYDTYRSKSNSYDTCRGSIAPVDVSARLMTPVDISTRLMKPVDISTRLMTPVDVSTRLMTPVDVSARLMTPVDIITRRMTPVDVSARLMTPVDISAKRMTPVDVSAKRMTPVDVSTRLMTPVDISARLMTPVDISAKRMTPVDVSARLMTPVDISAKRMTPVDVSTRLMTPVDISAKRMTPVDVSARLMTPVDISAKRMTPVDVSTRLMTPVDISARLMTPVDVSAKRMTPVDVSTRPTDAFGSPCSSNSNCKLANTICVDNMCQCDAGWSYSQNTLQCVRSCVHYGTMFTKIKQSYISGNDLITLTAPQYITASGCGQACVAVTSFTCLSFELDTTFGRCYLQSVTPFLVSLLDFLQLLGTTVDYYQRNCAYV